MAEKDWQHKMNHFWIWKIISYRYLDHRKKRVFLSYRQLMTDDWFCFYSFCNINESLPFFCNLRSRGLHDWQASGSSPGSDSFHPFSMPPFSDSTKHPLTQPGWPCRNTPLQSRWWEGFWRVFFWDGGSVDQSTMVDLIGPWWSVGRFDEAVLKPR